MTEHEGWPNAWELPVAISIGYSASTRVSFHACDTVIVPVGSSCYDRTYQMALCRGSHHYPRLMFATRLLATSDNA